VGEIEIEDDGMRVSVRRADEAVAVIAPPLAAIPEGADAELPRPAAGAAETHPRRGYIAQPRLRSRPRPPRLCGVRRRPNFGGIRGTNPPLLRLRRPLFAKKKRGRPPRPPPWDRAPGRGDPGPPLPALPGGL